MERTNELFERVRNASNRSAKRSMIEQAFIDPAIWALSDRRIAHECGLDPRTIWNYRNRVGADIVDETNPLGLDAGQHAALIEVIQRGERIGLNNIWQPVINCRFQAALGGHDDETLR